MLTLPTYRTRGIPLIRGSTRPAAVAEPMCATVLIAGLHGFDAIVEQLIPSEVAFLLEEFFALVTCAVLECGGQIFQLGEADQMAGFGVGDSRHTNIHEALTAACMIQKRFAAVRASWQERHALDADVGIGLHRGEVAIGVFGPPEHRAITLVGDAAHVAAQLCRRARAGEVLLSGAVNLPHNVATGTVGSADFAPLLYLPQLQLRGRSAALDVWCAPAPKRLQMCRSAAGRARHH
jgi:class 3 adenylate cyclase